jgi:glucose-6-phosphate dehydrogenase assembly protein OpcA
MGVVGEIERQLAQMRAREADGMPELRTSTMTHLVWAPPEWLPKARATLAGLLERHPARTIFLVPEPGRKSGVDAKVSVKDFSVAGLSRDVLSEVIVIRLRGAAVRHPASIVLPLLISDLPAFCRWRGAPGWDSSQLHEIVGVCDRLVVDSSEWPGVPRAYGRLVELFDRVAVSDIAFARTLPWRQRLAELWPAIGAARRLRVEGPKAEAALLGAWLGSRLEREIGVTRRDAETLRAVWVDGERVESHDDPLSPSDLLSAELDQFAHDPIYEGAVRRLAGK